MGDFFKALSENGNGVGLLLLFLLTVVLVVQWVCWIFAIGRFKKPPTTELGSISDGTGGTAISTGANSVIQITTTPRADIQHLLSKFLTEIITEFRHLLALLIFLMFALVLSYSVWRAQNVKEIGDVIESVVAALGGLVGSIIGYYFGESSVIGRDRRPPAALPSDPTPSQGPPSPVEPAAKAPGA